MARGNLEQHEIFLSGLRVRVQSCCTGTNRYLQRHWSAAKLPMLPTETSCDIEVIADASPRIIVDGEVVWAEGFGWADVEARVPVTSATKFRDGSVS